MSSWFADLVKDVNERPFARHEVDRIMAYYAGLPDRLQAAEALERLEPELVRTLPGQLAQQYPDRTAYTPALIRDLVLGLRHLAAAMLIDDPAILRRRWTRHLTRLAAAAELDVGLFRDVYVAVNDHLAARLPATAYTLVRPLLEELLDAFAGPAVPPPPESAR